MRQGSEEQSKDNPDFSVGVIFRKFFALVLQECRMFSSLEAFGRTSGDGGTQLRRMLGVAFRKQTHLCGGVFRRRCTRTVQLRTKHLA